MMDPEEKKRRLAAWYERLTDTFWVDGLDAWHRALRQEVSQLQRQGLIDANEAQELRELADAAYSPLSGA